MQSNIPQDPLDSVTEVERDLRQKLKDLHAKVLGEGRSRSDTPAMVVEFSNGLIPLTGEYNLAMQAALGQPISDGWTTGRLRAYLAGMTAFTETLYRQINRDEDHDDCDCDICTARRELEKALGGEDVDIGALIAKLAAGAKGVKVIKFDKKHE